ncbi:jerky protein homolog [Nylanderia fulva]|uniref:jerky protein homolog n=1 Tax=Nylanderia fulva TaxID=613905 RepID=UPI0010FB8A1F|nr:jerky protein homolog [Nylanderia fulva]
MAAEYNVCRNNERSQNPVNQSIEQEVDLDRKSHSYDILESELYKWFRQCKESGNMVGYQQFRTKGFKLMKKYDAPKTFEAKQAWLRRCMKRLEKLEESARESDHIKSSAKQFSIQELTHQLGQGNIKRDNVYIMFTKRFTWHRFLTPKDQKKINILKLKGCLNVTFCTNITGDHKLPPFYFYDCILKKTPKDFKKIPNLCTSKDKIQKILTDWYNNHFVTFVKKCQQKTNVSDKVLLIVNSFEMLLKVHAKDITQNDNFEIRFIIENTLLSVVKYINKIIRTECRKVFQDFCTSYDMNIYITTIDKAWDNIRSETVETLWKNLSDSCTKKIINVTEEDTTLKEISAQVEEPKNKSVEEYREEVTPPDDIIEDLNSHSEDEEKEHQEQQDNDKNNEELTDNFTKYSNSAQKIDGTDECQQLESTGSAHNIISVEENKQAN